MKPKAKDTQDVVQLKTKNSGKEHGNQQKPWNLDGKNDIGKRKGHWKICNGH